MYLEQHIFCTHLREISQFYRVKLHICQLKQAKGENRIPAHPLGTPWLCLAFSWNVCKPFPLIQIYLQLGGCYNPPPPDAIS